MNIKQWSKSLLDHPLFKILVVAFLLWMVYKTRFVLVTLFISYILAVALSPIKKFLIKRKIPEVLASLIPYILLIGIFVLIGYSIAPNIISQFRLLIQNFPDYLRQIGKLVGDGALYEYIQNSTSPVLSSLGGSVIPVTREVVKIVTYVVVGFALSIYIFFS